MPRRIDIELTSARDDGTWTWRAAGAQRPKGTLDAELLYEGARPGDVVRADADFEMDGITIVAVIPPRTRQATSDRIEFLGPPRSEEPGVQLFASKRPREDGRRPPRRDRDRDGDSRREPRAPGRERREPRETRGPRTERPARPARPAPTPPEPKPKPKKLSPGRARRDAVLAGLPPEHRPIAEQVLKGGIPAVRKAIEHENEKAAAEGRPEVNADALVAIAEELLPVLREAEWRDRADAAIADLDELAVRDLRAVVTAAETAVRDDESRALAAQLREGLDRRLTQQRDQWVDEVVRSLDDGRVVRALRISGRPPQPGTKFPQELAQRLSDAAGAALAPDTPPERWIAVLDAVASSPVRRTATPAGLPAEPGEDLLAAAKSLAPKVPAVAVLLGIEPAPSPSRPPQQRRRPPAPPGPPRRITPPGAPANPTIGATIPASGPSTAPEPVERPHAPEAMAPEPTPPVEPAAEPQQQEHDPIERAASDPTFETNPGEPTATQAEALAPDEC